MAYCTVEKALPHIVGQGEGKPMKKKSFLRFLGFQSDNPKAAPRTKSGPAYQNGVG